MEFSENLANGICNRWFDFDGDLDYRFDPGIFLKIFSITHK